MDAVARPEFYLTETTFVCLTDGTLVFLDLRHDKYMCLESRHTEAFTAMFGLPPQREDDATIERSEEAAAAPAPATACDGEVAKVARDLIERGLVTRDTEKGKRAELIPEAEYLKELPGYEIGEAPGIRAGHVLNFFRALVVVKFMLRFASMERIVTRVRRRRERHAPDQPNPAVRDREKINEMAEIYKILKPLFVTVKDNCLFNSFFLIEFLARYGIYPSWYFGVRLNEFYAHCWVQDGNMIYDDFIQTTCQNRPIMKV